MKANLETTPHLNISGDKIAPNLAVYDKVAHEYSDYALTRAEIEIVRRFKDSWHHTKMLDIGVGTGRTSYTFSALVDQYHGIDYSENMLTRCQDLIGHRDNCSLDLQNAADLSRYYGSSFDFVLFSLNGIDSVDHGQRLQILDEVRKVLHPDGYFFFSTHSLHSFGRQPKLPRIEFRRPLVSSYRLLKVLSRSLRLKWHYRKTDPDQVLAKDWETLVTGDHGFRMTIYHIKPLHQVTQLEDAGYQVHAVYDKAGRPIDPTTYEGNSYMYFLCKRCPSFDDCDAQ